MCSTSFCNSTQHLILSWDEKWCAVPVMYVIAASCFHLRWGMVRWYLCSTRPYTSAQLLVSTWDGSGYLYLCSTTACTCSATSLVMNWHEKWSADICAVPVMYFSTASCYNSREEVIREYLCSNNSCTSLQHLVPTRDKMVCVYICAVLVTVLPHNILFWLEMMNVVLIFV